MFKLNTVLISMLAASGFTTTAQAQQSQADDPEIIQVTGIRSSLNKSAAIKRDASGVVDAISAEDIGKFPDTNLAESLQRITGVSIDRTNGEGNQVTVRGFGPSFNLVTLNGRQMPRSSSLLDDGIPRNFNFREISAESVSGVEVHKSGKAHVYSGGIGSTINVTTARPFDHPGFKAVASAKAVMDTSNKDGRDITPELFAMVSNNMDGVFGISLSLSHAERDSGKERAGADMNWGNGSNNVNTSAIDTSKNPTKKVWAPFTSSVDVSNTERTRQNGQLVLQFAPTDDLVATLDYTLTRFEQKTQMNRMSLWFDSPTGTADSNGTLTNAVQTGDELNFWAWDYFEKTEGDSLGLNLEWHATDSLKFTFDAHDSTSESNPDGTNSENLANLANPGKLVDYTVDFSGEIPGITIDDSALAGGAFNKDNIIPDLFQTRGFQIKNNIKQYNLQGEWELDAGALSKVNFGVSNTTYAVDTKQFGTFAFVTDLDISGLDLTFKSTSGMLDAFSANGNIFPQIPRYQASQFIELTKDQDLFFQVAPTLNGIEEKTNAAFVSADFNLAAGNMDVSINTGLRYEQTDVTAYSVQEGITALQYFHVEELKAVLDGKPVAQNLEGDYDALLPNIDVKVDLTDELVARASYSKTITRSDIASMFPSTNLIAPRPGGPYNASQGNPNLLPFESDNIDLSLEYYYGDASYISVGYFVKDVDNFIGSSLEKRTINNVDGNPLTDPSVNPAPGCPDSDIPTPACFGDESDPVITWDVTTNGNMAKAKVDGWELNVQHMFAQSGFGAIANYTLVDADVAYNPFNLESQMALEGLSDSANLVAFYDDNGIQARIAYNWRDEFLKRGGANPIHVEAYGQIDANASYEINDNISVFVEALNITDEGTRSYERFPEQVLSAEQFGPRFNLGVRASF